MESKCPPRPWSQSSTQTPPFLQPSMLITMSRPSLGHLQGQELQTSLGSLFQCLTTLSVRKYTVGSILRMHLVLLTVLLPPPWALLSKETVSFGVGVWSDQGQCSYLQSRDLFIRELFKHSLNPAFSKLEKIVLIGWK